MPSWYDQAKYSDLTVYTEAVVDWDEVPDEYDKNIIIDPDVREVRCHKVVLAQASQFFADRLSPNTTSDAPEQEWLCLYNLPDEECNGDSGGPYNDAILMHCYDFDYAEICKRWKLGGPMQHLHVVQAAQKFLLPKLEQAASERLHASVKQRRESEECTAPHVALEFFELVQELLYDEAWDKRYAELWKTHASRGKKFDAGEKVYKPEFEALAKHILRRNLPQFFKMKEFRQWLEEKENAKILTFVTEVFEQGYSCSD